MAGCDAQWCSILVLAYLSRSWLFYATDQIVGNCCAADTYQERTFKKET